MALPIAWNFSIGNDLLRPDCIALLNALVIHVIVIIILVLLYNVLLPIMKCIRKIVQTRQSEDVLKILYSLLNIGYV